MSCEIEKIGPGQHIGLFYRSRTEQLSAVVPYLLNGLKRNERCLYIAEENSVGLVLKYLRDGGCDVDAAMSCGALRVTTKAETYLRHGVFQPAKMAHELREEVNRALADGFAGFRGSGEMSWALALESTLAKLTEYEEALHREFPTKFIGLCQYNEVTFPPRIISEMIRWHRTIFARGRLFDNPFFTGSVETSSANSHNVTVEQVIDASGAERPHPGADN